MAVISWAHFSRRNAPRKTGLSAAIPQARLRRACGISASIPCAAQGLKLLHFRFNPGCMGAQRYKR
jgi:hypothetical protein